MMKKLKQSFTSNPVLPRLLLSAMLGSGLCSPVLGAGSSPVPHDTPLFVTDLSQPPGLPYLNSLLASDDGGFVVTYLDEPDRPSDLRLVLRAQRYDRYGNLISGPAVLSAAIPVPEIVMDGKGNVMSTELLSGQYMLRLFDKNLANPRDVPLLLRFPDGRSIGEGQLVAVDAIGKGGFIVVYTTSAPDASYVYAQRFDADARPVGRTIPITRSRYRLASLFVDADDRGNFLVAWNRLMTVNGTDRNTVIVRRFWSNGSPSGDEVTLFPRNGCGETFNKLETSMDADGDFILTCIGNSFADRISAEFNARGIQKRELPPNATIKFVMPDVVGYYSGGANPYPTIGLYQNSLTFLTLPDNPALPPVEAQPQPLLFGWEGPLVYDTSPVPLDAPYGASRLFDFVGAANGNILFAQLLDLDGSVWPHFEVGSGRRLPEYYEFIVTSLSGRFGACSHKAPETREAR